MTEVEVTKKILEQRHCGGVHCAKSGGFYTDDCPACLSDCAATRTDGHIPVEFACGLDSKSRKFFEDFLKSKEAKGMDKEKAIKRLDALDHEAAELRKIIEKGNKLEYNQDNLYVVIIDGCPYILCGYKDSEYFRWHSFVSIATEQAWSEPSGTGQEALDYVSKYDIHVFTDPKEGIKFFYDQYMKAH